MNIDSLNRVHFIGIGGIGMSALAKFFLFRNIEVSGYDKVCSSITKSLSKDGANIIYEDDLSLIKSKDEIDLVVYTPAIPSDNRQLDYFSSSRIPFHKRAYILGQITKSYHTIAVAGTHGKTTTSSIIAHILQYNKLGGVSFLGGISTNYNSNILLQDGNNAVVEADEYDRSFLKLFPNMILLTSMDPDHLDIYGDNQSLIEGFKLFTALLENKNKLIVQEDLNSNFNDCLTYGFHKNSSLSIQHIRIQKGGYFFDVIYKNKLYVDFEFYLPGKYNLLNAAGAILCGFEMGLDAEQIKNSLASFSGVKRRFEVHYDKNDIVYIDDYAHHPKEITALVNGLRDFYPKHKIIGVFQPHLYSRTRDFMHGFQEALSLLDQLFLMPIYPAREKPIKDVSSENLLIDIALESKSVLNNEDDLFLSLKQQSKFVLVTIGAGDIDLLINPIKTFLHENF